MKEEPPDVGAELFVEEVLELKRPAALDRLRRVQRWLRVAFLERADDRGRVADAPAVEFEDRRRVAPAAGQRERDRHVIAGHERAALVPDALQVERPSRLLVVVRDLDVPEDRAGVHLHLPKRLVPSASARGVAGTDRRGQPLRLGLDDRSLGNIASTPRGSWHTDWSVGRYVRNMPTAMRHERHESRPGRACSGRLAGARLVLAATRDARAAPRPEARQAPVAPR